LCILCNYKTLVYKFIQILLLWSHCSPTTKKTLIFMTRTAGVWTTESLKVLSHKNCLLFCSWEEKFIIKETDDITNYMLQINYSNIFVLKLHRNIYIWKVIIIFHCFLPAVILCLVAFASKNNANKCNNRGIKTN